MQPGPLPRTRDEAIRAAIALVLAAAHEVAGHRACGNATAAFAAANQLANAALFVQQMTLMAVQEAEA